MEAAGGIEQTAVEFGTVNFIDRSVHPVVYDAGLSRMSPVFIIINAEPRIMIPVVYEVVITDSTEADTVFDKGTDIAVGYFGNNAGAQPQEGHA